MRILIINQPFWPDVVATAQHMADWSEFLVQRGHEVTVIASRSVYGRQGAVLAKRERHQGVEIYRVGSNLFAKGRLLTRLVDFGLFHFRALWRALTLPRQDVVVCLTTPPFIGVVGRLVKMFRGSKYVQYEMDLYPDVPIALGVMRGRGVAARGAEAVHRWLLKGADRVVVLGRCMKRVVEAKGIGGGMGGSKGGGKGGGEGGEAGGKGGRSGGGAGGGKLVLVTPWADPEEIKPVARGENGFRRAHHFGAEHFVIMYSGNFGLAHDLGTVCAVMEKLAGSDEPGDRAVRFVFIGGGKRMEELRRFVEEKKLGNVLLLGYEPRERLGETLSAGDVHLITQAVGTSGLIVPSKFYGILAAGRPSVYVGPEDTEVAMTIREHGVGEVVGAGDVEGLVAAIQRMRAADGGVMERRCRELVEREYSRAKCCAALTEMVEGLGKTRR